MKTTTPVNMGFLVSMNIIYRFFSEEKMGEIPRAYWHQHLQV